MRSSDRRATNRADSPPLRPRRSARCARARGPPPQWLHDECEALCFLVDHTAHHERLRVGRPVEVLIVSCCEPTEPTSVYARDPDAGSRREREQPAVGRELGVEPLPRHTAETGPVGTRDVDRAGPIRVGAICDGSAVARQGHRIRPAAAREQRRQARPVRPDAVHARLSVPVAAEQNPLRIPSGSVGRRSRRASGGRTRQGDREREQAAREQPARSSLVPGFSAHWIRAVARSPTAGRRRGAHRPRPSRTSSTTPALPVRPGQGLAPVRA